MSQDEELEEPVSPTIQESNRVSENNFPDTIEMLYIESSNIGLVEFRKRIQSLYRTREATLIREALERIKQFQYPTGTNTNGKEDFAVSVNYIDAELINQQKGEQ